MGRVAVAVGEANCHSGVVDRLAMEGILEGRESSANLCPSGGRAGEVLPQSLSSAPAPRATENAQARVELRLLWFELSDEERRRFGGCFSQMVLKAVKRGTVGEQEAAA
jgi:hypothetical protein